MTGSKRGGGRGGGLMLRCVMLRVLSIAAASTHEGRGEGEDDGTGREGDQTRRPEPTVTAARRKVSGPLCSRRQEGGA